LASVADDHTVRIWEADSGRLLRTLEGHQAPVLSVVYHPDGQQLASGAHDNTVRIWEADSGRLLRTLKGHYSGVFAVAWLPPGRRLASCSQDGSIRIWDVESGRCLVTLYQFPDGGWLALTPDGHYTGNTAGKRRLTFADNWALYPAELFPEMEDPEAVRAALA
jgi:WD40 repeat protein